MIPVTLLIGEWKCSLYTRVVGRADPTTRVELELRHTGRAVHVLRIVEFHNVYTLEESYDGVRSPEQLVDRKSLERRLKRSCGKSLRDIMRALEERADAEAEDRERFGYDP